MPDDRTVEAKLQALIAPGSGATDGERAAAGAALRRIRRVAAAGMKSTRVLTRESVMAQADSDSPPRTKRVLIRGTWYVVDIDDYIPDWAP